MKSFFDTIGEGADALAGKLYKPLVRFLFALTGKDVSTLGLPMAAAGHSIVSIVGFMDSIFFGFVFTLAHGFYLFWYKMTKDQMKETTDTLPSTFSLIVFLRGIWGCLAPLSAVIAVVTLDGTDMVRQFGFLLIVLAYYMLDQPKAKSTLFSRAKDKLESVLANAIARPIPVGA